MDAIIQQANRVLQIDEAAITAYQKNEDNLLADVNTIMQSHPELDRFLGGNPIQMMWNNHQNHVRFMTNTFKLQDGRLLVRTVVWVYRSYVAHGFHPDYFPAELRVWMQAIEKCLNPQDCALIKPVYEFLIEHHTRFVEQTNAERLNPDENQLDENRQYQKRLTEVMLRGDEKAALRIAKDFVHSNERHREFLLQIVQPALIDIGTLWEKGRISVAQEHLATAIARRLMSILYERIDLPEQEIARVVVTTAPGEYHDVGARMVSDFLEMEGLQTYFLGADTPKEELISLLKEVQADIVMISISMPYNLDLATDVIREVKSEPTLSKTLVMVGGQAFGDQVNLWRKTGADDWAKDAMEVCAVVKQRLSER